MRHRSFALVILLLITLAVPARAQQIPAPAGPVVLCVNQAPPAATSWKVAVDGGAFADLSMDATKDARCAAADTHSFRLAASLFTVGSHTIRLRSINVFGETVGPLYTVVVGIAPGEAVITAIHAG